jgi:hypothetical protein
VDVVVVVVVVRIWRDEVAKCTSPALSVHPVKVEVEVEVEVDAGVEVES